MASNKRIKQRTSPYAIWESVNQNTPGGLKIMQGEICVVLADAASAAAGLSNIVADLTRPKPERLANAGEVLGIKIGEGSMSRWDEIPLNFHMPTVRFLNGTGRILGTQLNGASYDFKHPGLALRAVFAGVYSPPGVNVRLYSGDRDLNGQIAEIGQVLDDVRVQVNSGLGTYRIKEGRALENTGVVRLLGQAEMANDPNSIASFSRAVDNMLLLPANSRYDAGNGLFSRVFTADVTDARPSNEGGANTVTAGQVATYATYPTFFGKTAAAIPAGGADLGAFLQATCTPLLRGRGRYDAGKVAYRGGERPLLAYPAMFGPLSQILDELGLNQLGYSGAAFAPARTATLSKQGSYANVEYLAYTTTGGFNADILFSFLP